MTYENMNNTNINDKDTENKKYNMKLKPCKNMNRSVSPLSLPPTHNKVNKNIKEIKNNVHYCDFCNCIIL